MKQSVSIPLAVKIGPYFSSLGNMAKRLVEAGADGLVLFNRFLQPDIDLDTLEAVPKLVLSTPEELLQPLRWIAILHGRVPASLAATGGIHCGGGLIKALLAGADVGMVVSALYSTASARSRRSSTSSSRWIEEKEYDSVEQLKGHEPGELPRPRRLRTRQLHEGPGLLHRPGDLTTARKPPSGHAPLAIPSLPAVAPKLGVTAGGRLRVRATAQGRQSRKWGRLRRRDRATP